MNFYFIKQCKIERTSEMYSCGLLWLYDDAKSKLVNKRVGLADGVDIKLAVCFEAPLSLKISSLSMYLYQINPCSVLTPITVFSFFFSFL